MPRIWSNNEIRKLAPLFNGDIANISGWDDRDKEGSCYKDYFKEATSYTVTNYRGERGLSNGGNEIFLDLSLDLPQNLIGKFDACFNHTTLEHIFDVRKAFSTICSMSRDIVLIIVPFSQTQHESESFKDFWRFTPSCIRQFFKENGMDTIYEAQSTYKNAGIYLFFIGSKCPDKWKNILPSFEPIIEVGDWIGYSFLAKITDFLKKKFVARK